MPHHPHHSSFFLFFEKLSNPALISSHMYVEFDKIVEPSPSFLSIPINAIPLSITVLLPCQMVPLCSLHHSTITNTLSPHANSVGKHVILDAMEAQMTSTIIWAIGKAFFNSLLVFLVFLVLIISLFYNVSYSRQPWMRDSPCPAMPNLWPSLMSRRSSSSAGQAR